MVVRGRVNKHRLAPIGISHDHSQSGQDSFIHSISPLSLFMVLQLPFSIIFFTVLCVYSKFTVLNSVDLPFLTRGQGKVEDSVNQIIVQVQRAPGNTS